jgi:hypothetical protein
MPAPAALASQKPELGRSCAIKAAAAAVASGKMPSTTPPCAAGTVTMASAISTGKPMMVQIPVIASVRQFAGEGGRQRITSSVASPAQPAIVARAALRNRGSKARTASFVAGSVPANSIMPASPSRKPKVSREWRIAGKHVQAGSKIKPSRCAAEPQTGSCPCH